MSEIIRVSLDLETMSLENNAGIVQIGACTIVDSAVEDCQVFNSYISPESSEKAGLHVDVGTMYWWNKQDEAIRKRVFSGTTSLGEALFNFTRWVDSLCQGKLENIRLYSKGGEDIIWLKSAYYAATSNWPFHYRSPQNLRTLMDAMDYAGLTVPQFLNDAPHDALADAISQAKAVRWMLNQVKWSQPTSLGHIAGEI